MSKEKNNFGWNETIQKLNKESNEILDVKKLKDKDIRSLKVGFKDLKRVFRITGIVPRNAKIINCYTTQKGVVFVYEIAD